MERVKIVTRRMPNPNALGHGGRRDYIPVSLPSLRCLTDVDNSGQTSPFAAAAIAGDGFRYEPDRNRLGQISGKIIDATARFHRGVRCSGGANGLVERGVGAAEADAGDRLSQYDYT